MKSVPFYRPNISEDVFRQVNDVLHSGWITTGTKVKEFEYKFSAMLGSTNGIAVSSGTAALHLAYIVSGLKKGDEVIVPSFTFCSTINMLIHVGAIPVFCDIDEQTLCLDPLDIEHRITPKTKAIVVVHYAGISADMDKINELAKKYHLKVIEDAAHAFMTKYKGHYIGNTNNIVCFSFYATKNLTTAEGGMVLTKNKKQAERIRLLSMHGMSKNSWNRYTKDGQWKYDVLFPGFKYNLTDIHASIGLGQLNYAQNSHTKRLTIAAEYKKRLVNLPDLFLPEDPPYKDSEHAWHLFTIRLKDTARVTREEMINKLKSAGIGTSVHFIPNHMQSYYRKRFKKIKLPITEKVYGSILSLPMFDTITINEIDYISKEIRKILK